MRDLKSILIIALCFLLPLVIYVYFGWDDTDANGDTGLIPTIDEEVEIIELGDSDIWDAADYIIELEEEGDILMEYIQTTSVVFGNNIGKISWEKGYMTFEGNADESARMFFEGFLKPLIDKYIQSESNICPPSIIPEIEEPEMTLIEFTTEGEFAKTFKPEWFLKVNNTDLSKCLTDNRLRINLNGEIYWIRLEED